MNSTNMMELPTEILTKVFSYLGADDKIRVAGVCQKFREVALHPLIWRMNVIVINNTKDLINFCTKFNAHLHVKLSLSFYFESRSLTEEETFYLNELFRKSKRLIWLHLDNINLQHINLPANLKRLRYAYASKCADLIAQLISIDKCLFLEHLHLEDITPSTMTTLKFETIKDAFITLLGNHKESLQSLYLNVGTMPRDWMNIISNCCKNLKLFGASTEPMSEEEAEAPGIWDNYISNFSQLPNLETIFLQSRIKFPNSEDCVALPNVKNPFINAIDHKFGRNDFSFILKTFPNLKTIFIPKATGDSTLDFIAKAKSLKYIGICSFEVNSEKIIKIQKEMQYKKICLCDSYLFQYPQSPMDEAMKATFPKEKCIFHFLNPFQELIWDQYSIDYSSYRGIPSTFMKLNDFFLF